MPKKLEAPLKRYRTVKNNSSIGLWQEIVTVRDKYRRASGLCLWYDA